jgi:hypothetical protein
VLTSTDMSITAPPAATPAALSDVTGDAVVAGWGPSSGLRLSGLLVRDAG